MSNLFQRGKDFSRFLTGLIEYFKNGLLVLWVPEVSAEFPPGMVPKVQRQMLSVSPQTILKVVDTLWEFSNKYQQVQDKFLFAQIITLQLIQLLGGTPEVKVPTKAIGFDIASASSLGQQFAAAVSQSPT